ncbi:MAG: DJ-1/PfpI family protein [Planctomycetota bacterium]|nr:MAG: DJ-1/PfpI family protein [Planctomycetota bacterium]
MHKRVLVLLADGFEEIEAVAIVDTLRRADLEVVTAALRADPSRIVHGAHGIDLAADRELDACIGPNAPPFAALVLPGGMPGTQHLGDDPRVLELIRAMHAAGKLIAAICAAPSVLAKAGVLEGVPATSFPGFQGKLAGAHVERERRVVVAGSIVTSQGPGTAIEFALELVHMLVGSARATELERAMIVNVPAALPAHRA